MTMNSTKTGIASGKKARRKLLKGVNRMADAVGSTLGPMGQNVAIEKFAPNGEVYDRIILHDGVSVARSIVLKDPYENMGAQILKEVSQKQVDAVGDGTTVTMILAQAIINKGFQLIDAGVKPMSLRKGLEKGLTELLAGLEEMATPTRGIKDLKFIATISAEDEELGELVANTLEKVGKDGVVTVEESKSPETLVEHQEGMQFDKGYLHPYFVTNPERMEAVMENAYILVTDKPITTLMELGPFFEAFVKQSKNLVVISPDISGEALPLFIQNKLQGKLFTICIQAPSFGADQKAILEDIATLTGATFNSEDAGFKFEDLTIDHLGFAENITSTKDETIIVGGRGTKEDIETRIASIKRFMEDLDSDFETERAKARLGKLTNGVAVIRVGGQTEIEMKERRERVLDALGATRAAMEKGIVPGGEIVYLNLLKKEILLETSDANAILKDALYRPFQRLITNADLSENDVAVALNGQSVNFGVDVIDGKVKDLVKAGIVDPVLVPMNALRNAVSVSIQLLTTGYIIVPEVNHTNE